MKRAVIAGVGMTPFGMFMDRGTRAMAEEAVGLCLADAGLTPDDVGFVAYSNASSGVIAGQHCIRGEVALRNTGLLGKPIVNVENACASGSSAVHLAWLQVASGLCDVAVAVGTEKLSHPDKARVLAGMSAGADLDEIADMRARLGGGEDRSIFMDIYADLAERYMSASGATREDFACISVKSRKAASLNPRAQFRKEVTIEEVLASRAVAGPLTLMMCSPIGDGAAAVVVTSEDFARRQGLRKPIFIRASVVMSGLGDQEGPTAAARAARKAYDDAGVGPDEIDVVEVHDATASAEIALLEDLGLCGPGCGPDFVRSGATGLNGKVAVNSSGGLLSRGHPIGATGCAQIVELVEQLNRASGPRQREGAKIALAENGGGYMGKDAAVAVVTILSA